MRPPNDMMTAMAKVRKVKRWTGELSTPCFSNSSGLSSGEDCPLFRAKMPILPQSAQCGARRKRECDAKRGRQVEQGEVVGTAPGFGNQIRAFGRTHDQHRKQRTGLHWVPKHRGPLYGRAGKPSRTTTGRQKAWSGNCRWATLKDIHCVAIIGAAADVLPRESGGCLDQPQTSRVDVIILACISLMCTYLGPILLGFFFCRHTPHCDRRRARHDMPWQIGNDHEPDHVPGTPLLPAVLAIKALFARNIRSRSFLCTTLSSITVELVGVPP
nr:hypothetical protein CFP56_23856 [Quercus suber]